MKRAFSFEYSSDEEFDALLAEALDEFERHMRVNDVNQSIDDDDSDDDYDWLDDSEDDQLLANAVDEAEQRGAQVNQRSQTG